MLTDSYFAATQFGGVTDWYSVAFPAAAVEELTALRFRVDIVELENASLHARIRTMEAIEMVIRNHERKARIEIERQLAVGQESHRRDQ
ncbi:hypothetical protein Tco_1153084 [Tanacetum coccineum]